MQLPNKVELLGWYGDDTTIACSAWTSTSRDLTEDKKNRIGRLIETLWSVGHETPFEKATIHFLVNTDIASHIHLIKHRLSSLNAESARYKELKEDKYYIPEDWTDISSNTNFAGYTNWTSILKWYTELGNSMYHECVKDLEPTLGRKRAKESARFFKTYNSQIQADVLFNMRSFANFIKLRRCNNAQLEIRMIADKMLKIVRNLDGEPFKHTLSAWEKSGIIKDIQTSDEQN